MVSCSVERGGGAVGALLVDLAVCVHRRCPAERVRGVYSVARDVSRVLRCSGSPAVPVLVSVTPDDGIQAVRRSLFTDVGRGMFVSVGTLRENDNRNLNGMPSAIFWGNLSCTTRWQSVSRLRSMRWNLGQYRCSVGYPCSPSIPARRLPAAAGFAASHARSSYRASHHHTMKSVQSSDSALYIQRW